MLTGLQMGPSNRLGHAKLPKDVSIILVVAVNCDCQLLKLCDLLLSFSLSGIAYVICELRVKLCTSAAVLNISSINYCHNNDHSTAKTSKS
jgi:hypothetical protein